MLVEGLKTKMINKLIYSIAHPRHPWRTMKFDELAEIYTSMTLRSLGFSLVGIFVPIYLYQAGVSLQSIFLFFTIFFALRIPVAFVAAFVVGRIGPKHTIAVSTVLFIVFLSLLLSFNTLGWPLLLIAFFYTLANGLFFVAINTDFSKVKHKNHGGKELGWLYIFERAGGALGPIVGGLLAGLFAPEVTMVFAIIVLLGSLVPLFMTNEPVKVHQKVKFKNFPYMRHVRDYISLGAFNIVNVANGVFWPLLIGVFIFTEDTYAKLGVLVGVSLAISIISARMFGKMIDIRKGEVLLSYGTVMNTVLNTVRSMITASGGAIAASVLGEPIGLAYRMPLTKGFYDSADSEPGYRIVYVSVIEIATAIAKALYCLALFLSCYFYESIDVLRFQFIFVALVGFIMLFHKFPALKKV